MRTVTSDKRPKEAPVRPNLPGNEVVVHCSGRLLRWPRIASVCCLYVCTEKRRVTHVGIACVYIG